LIALRALAAASLQPFDISVETDSFPALRAVLQDGRHLVLYTSDLYAEDVRDGRVVALPIREKATVAVRSQAAARREMPAMRLFAEFVRKVVREAPVPKRGVFR
jgi:hypothetical protein